VCNDEGKWGYVDYTGKVVADFKFDLCNTFREGYVTIPLTENGVLWILQVKL